MASGMHELTDVKAVHGLVGRTVGMVSCRVVHDAQLMPRVGR